jgi:hypothetical protein
LNFTVGASPKLDPLIVTGVPTTPELGINPLIVGAVPPPPAAMATSQMAMLPDVFVVKNHRI